mmetsp:Transcript_53146/g.172845  ORF Transcript_53146/g.172845 Transcript_53146/m.172845 type:complete len:289 (+) Transcript_53146:1020-1886(+)
MLAQLQSDVRVEPTTSALDVRHHDQTLALRRQVALLLAHLERDTGELPLVWQRQRPVAIPAIVPRTVDVTAYRHAIGLDWSCRSHSLLELALQTRLLYALLLNAGLHPYVPPRRLHALRQEDLSSDPALPLLGVRREDDALALGIVRAIPLALAQRHHAEHVPTDFRLAAMAPVAVEACVLGEALEIGNGPVKAASQTEALVRRLLPKRACKHYQDADAGAKCDCPASSPRVGDTSTPRTRRRMDRVFAKLANLSSVHVPPRDTAFTRPNERPPHLWMGAIWLYSQQP